MDEALDLLDYLPVSFKTPSEEEYISYLWDAFESNYADGKYQFAFLAYHMLMMSFVYFNIWQIKQTRPADFQKGLIGFASNENALLNATSPFSFSIVNERTVLRFLKLSACDNSKIGVYAKLIDNRNDTTHANGNIFFSTQREVDDQIRKILRAVDEIQSCSRSIVESFYTEFILQNHDAEEREYLNADDQIREMLIRDNYMSQRDIELCINFDVSVLEHDQFEQIEALHKTLCAMYEMETV